MKKCKKCEIITDEQKFRKNRNTCRICENKNRKEYYENNKESEILRIKKYKKENRITLNKARRINSRNKYQNNINNFKLEACLRTRFIQALKNNTKKNHTFTYIGCTISELKTWLEYNFKDDMTWENHGKLWHIDHIIPCASFDLSNEEHIYKCFHWSNLAPLIAIENYKKSSKIDNDKIEYYKCSKEKFIKLLKSKHNYALEPLIPNCNRNIIMA